MKVFTCNHITSTELRRCSIPALTTLLGKIFGIEGRYPNNAQGYVHSPKYILFYILSYPDMYL